MVTNKKFRVTVRLEPHYVGFLKSIQKTLNCDRSCAVKYALSMAIHHISETKLSDTVSDTVSD